MKKILFLSNTANFSKFNRPYMRWFQEHGWQVDYCSSGEETILDCDNQYSIPITRSPFSLKNFIALRKLKKLLVKNHYDILHCHTPMGGVIGRLAAKKLWKQHKIKVIYTAHGFHFYKGAPLKNWICYYPIEKILSRFCDTIITINEEDFKCAKAFFHSHSVYKINGVGVNLKKFYPVTHKEKVLLRQSKGFLEDDFILIYTAEFISRKNHKLLFDILPNLKREISSLKVILCGNGELLEYYKNYAEQNNLNYIFFTGYTKDVVEYYRLSDVFIMPSFQEGLPMAMIEAMATGLPIIASNIRGHRDIITNKINGFLFNLNENENCKKLILELYTNKDLYLDISKNNIKQVQDYSIEKSLRAMSSIYSNIINHDRGGVLKYSIYKCDTVGLSPLRSAA